MADYSQYGKFTIPQVSFTTNRWKPQELKFEAPDPNITQRALSIYEERENKAIAETKDLHNTFQELRKNFGDDAETQQWFDSELQKVNASINEASSRGDMQGAMKAAIDGANKFKTSAETTARENAWNEYKTIRDKVRTDKTLEPTTIERWESENKFKTDLTYDDNGNVTGYKPYATSMKFGVSGLPVADVDWKAGMQEIISPAAEQKTTNSTTNKNDNETYRGGQFSSFTASANGLEITTETGTVILSKEKLTKNLEEWANRNNQALIQKRDNLEYEERKYRAELETTTDPDQRERIIENLKYYEQFHDKYGGYKHTTALDIAKKFMNDTILSAAKYDTTANNVFKKTTADKSAPQDEAARAAAARAAKAAVDGKGTDGEGSDSLGVTPTHYKDQDPTDETREGKPFHIGVTKPEEASSILGFKN